MVLACPWVGPGWVLGQALDLTLAGLRTGLGLGPDLALDGPPLGPALVPDWLRLGSDLDPGLVLVPGLALAFLWHGLGSALA